MSALNLTLVAAVDQNWGIGQAGDLLFHLRDDMRRFREITTGGIVIMGRKTLESLPGGRPLPDRTNIVLSRSAGASSPDYTVYPNAASVLAALASMREERSAFVIGGQQVYEQFLPWCLAALITFVQCSRPHDRKMPNLDATSGWRCVKESVPREENGLSFTYREYKNMAPAEFAA